MASALCQIDGCLVVAEFGDELNPGAVCPIKRCGGTKLRDGPHGWRWCEKCNRFAIDAKSHDILIRKAKEWATVADI